MDANPKISMHAYNNDHYNFIHTATAVRMHSFYIFMCMLQVRQKTP